MLAHEKITGVKQNIVVMLDSTQDDLRKEFRCNSCGRLVFHYYGGVKLILPGGGDMTDWLDIVGRPKEFLCQNSRMVHRPDLPARQHEWIKHYSGNFYCRRCGDRSSIQHDNHNCEYHQFKCDTTYHVIG